MTKFKEILDSSIKSKDTEEWLDMYFTRPVGLVIALAGKRVGMHPNTITIISIVLGLGAAYMFAHDGLAYNVAGVLLLMAANFCDSADGQLARLTGQKTLAGRILDGFAGDVWFFAIYVAICLRTMYRPMPGVDMVWGVWIWALAVIAGLLCHSPQSSLADYYRQIHLLFLKGREGSELDTYAGQRAVYDSLPARGALMARLFYFNYANYCRSQERRSPKFQKLMATVRSVYGDVALMPGELRREFLDGSRPLMKYTNILTFNMRALCLYVTSLLGCPWVYSLVEITVFTVIYVYMHKRHESLCEGILKKIEEQKSI